MLVNFVQWMAWFKLNRKPCIGCLHPFITSQQEILENIHTWTIVAVVNKTQKVHSTSFLWGFYACMAIKISNYGNLCNFCWTSPGCKRLQVAVRYKLALIVPMYMVVWIIYTGLSSKTSGKFQLHNYLLLKNFHEVPKKIKLFQTKIFSYENFHISLLSTRCLHAMHTFMTNCSILFNT